MVTFININLKINTPFQTKIMIKFSIQVNRKLCTQINPKINTKIKAFSSISTKTVKLTTDIWKTIKCKFSLKAKIQISVMSNSR